ncbi:hypothetical protein BKD30_12345 [Tersicoccus phoenicis]|uniref:DUF898 domain-containing protein n=1 Tax=Tersicoccus phoenicis TaxID=554083 RepID=A0A1R1L7L3_9MICC|nr:hypothetical protein BKD30_12345 [Tersicoccus phoenicis]
MAHGAGSLYEFRGGAGTWFATELVGALLIVFTLGFGYPYAIVMSERWRAENTYLNGHQLKFVGSGSAMFGLWVKWFLLCLITLGIYSFWVAPRMMKWRTENTVLA